MKERNSPRIVNDYTPIAPSNNFPAMVGSALYSLPRPEVKTAMDSMRDETSSRNFVASKTQGNFFKRRNLSMIDGDEKPSQISVDVAQPTKTAQMFRRRNNSTQRTYTLNVSDTIKLGSKKFSQMGI